MLGLGTDLIYPQHVAVGGEVQLELSASGFLTYGGDDENVQLQVLASGAETAAHISNDGAITSGGAKLNCTIEMTWQRMDGATVLETSNPTTFNCFLWNGEINLGGTIFFSFLVSTETGDTLNLTNYFNSGSEAIDLTSLNGSDVTDGGDNLGQYRVSMVLKSDGALDSASVTSATTPIDAA